MNKVEQLPKSVQEQSEATMESANTFAASIKTITTAHADYTKKAFQDGSEFISKLTGTRSPTEAMKLQADYAKSAYETYVAESKKIFELYGDLARQTFKPFQNLIAEPAK
jgi:phasin family protein